MQKNVVGGVMALLLALSPLVAMAQVLPLDDDERPVVVGLAQRVGATLVPGITALPGDGEESIEAPDPEAEEPESEPVTEIEELPELNLTDLAEYSSQGVTIQAPADWIVDTEMSDDIPFIIEVPGTDLFMTMEADANLDFPSWLGLALFLSQAETLLGEMGSDALLDEIATFYTEQNLPVAKIAFTGTDFGGSMSGGLYLIAPNESAYIMVGGGTPAEWAYAAPGFDLIAQSVRFDDDLINVTFVEGEELAYVDESESVAVTVPPGWYVMSTGDEQFPIMVAEQEVRYVAAVGNEGVLGETFDASLLEQIPALGEIDEEEADILYESILSSIEDAGSPILIDEELTQFTARENALMVRIGGAAELDDELTIPVVFYIDLRVDGVGAIAVFGDIERALADETALLAMAQSITGQ
jgi:hypothetical protein